MRIGFIGTGHMGNPIARHLLRAGNQLVVHDRRQEAAANLIELGAEWADTPREVSAGSELVFMSLPGPPEVDEAVSGDDGVLAGAAPAMILVDLTTSLPSAVRRVAQLAAARGVGFLDAPLSGLVTGAEEGTLTTFVGGEASVLEAVRPQLESFTRHIFHVGEVGMGCILKLTNNIIVHGSSLFVQECLAMGVKAGLDPQRLFEIWSVSSSSRFVQDVPMWLQADYDDPPFSTRLAAKDSGLAVEAARELGVSMPLGSAASQVYLRAVARGYGDLLRQGGALLTIQKDAGVEVVKDRWV